MKLIFSDSTSKLETVSLVFFSFSGCEQMLPSFTGFRRVALEGLPSCFFSFRLPVAEGGDGSYESWEIRSVA